MHPRRTQLHAVHDKVDLVHNGTDHFELGRRQRLFDRLQRRRLTEALKVCDLAAGETMINPKLLPKARLSACAVYARRKVERRLSGKNGLSRHTGNSRHPGKGSALVEPPRRKILAEFLRSAEHTSELQS